jgi:nucleoid-associated protein YgaU
MQRIERYGVIALIFLLVTIVAVSFWGENGEGGLWSRFTGGAKEEPASEVARHDPRVNARSVARSIGGELPLTTPGMQDSAAPRPSSSTTLAERRALRRRALEEQGQVPGRVQDGLGELDRATPAPEAVEPVTATPLYSEPVRVPPTPAAAQASVAQQASAQQASAARRAAPGGTYVVQSGDTLGEIAQKTLGSATRWKEIQAANPGLDPKRLVVGAKLALPGGAPLAATGQPTVAAAPKPSAPAAATAAKPAARTYVVRSGDTLSRIAAAELGDAERWREIAAANPRVDPNRLFVGAQLALPGARDAGLVAYAERSTPRERPQPAEAAPSARPRVR